MFAAAGSATVAPVVGHQSFPCDLRSNANHRYVSAELGFAGALNGLLRARATSVGTWEQFQCVAEGAGRWAIKSKANGRFVSAELGYSAGRYGMLRARATAVGVWETYSFVPVNSCGCYAVRGANAKFVSAELGYPGSTYGVLRARSSGVGPWEEFTIHDESVGAAGSTTTTVPAECGGCAWPMFRFGASHTGFNASDTAIDATSVSTLVEEFRAPTGGAVNSSPAVAGGVVYVGSDDGRLYAFDAGGVTGCSGAPRQCAPLWTATAGDAVDSSPAVVNGVVYVGSSFADQSGALSAFDAAGSRGCGGSPKTCAPLWTAPVGGSVSSSPTVAGGVAYVTSADGSLYAFDASGTTGCSGVPKTCTPLWRAYVGTDDTSGFVASSPAVADGVVYVGGNGLSAFDATATTHCSGIPKTCTPLWSANVAYAIVSSPTIANGFVYVGDVGDRIDAFDASGASHCGGTPKVCKPIWIAKLGWSIMSSPAVANGIVYIGSEAPALFALDANGLTNCSPPSPTYSRVCTPLWSAPLPTGIGVDSSPAVANNVVYVGSDDNNLYAFDATGTLNCTGTPRLCAPLWTATTAGPIYSSPAIANRTIYVGSQDNSLHAYSLPN